MNMHIYILMRIAYKVGNWTYAVGSVGRPNVEIRAEVLDGSSKHVGC